MEGMRWLRRVESEAADDRAVERERSECTNRQDRIGHEPIRHDAPVQRVAAGSKARERERGTAK
jgi:hypothetical protein